MKNWSLLFLFFFFTNLLIAQVTVPDRQIGFDATAFITRFLSFNASNSGTSNPEILFLYRKEKDGKHLRYGIGGRLDVNKLTTSNQSRNEFIARLDFKFGREYHKNISERWRTYFGWDALIGLAESSSKFSDLSNPDDVSKSYTRGGTIRINPLVGIQYFLNDRLSFSTEMAYGLEFEAFFRSNSRKTYAMQTFYSPPISLFLNYKI